MEEVTDKLFNKGIKSFGKDNVIQIINRFNDSYNLPFVSIGSGYGGIEYSSIKYNSNINWICIDIDPLKFPIKNYLDKPLMKIDYLTTDDLIKDNSSIISNCILFLNWCEPNDSTYDYDAIIKLKPRAILSIYEVFEGNNGAAGGEKFFEWTENNKDYILKEMYKLNPHPDNIDNYVMDIRISWWQHSSIYNHNQDYNTIEEYIDSKINHQEGCFIM